MTLPGCGETGNGRIEGPRKEIIPRLQSGTLQFCNSMKPTLLVLAAGMGSRYGGLKQIDPVGPMGETIIDYSVFDALRGGFGKIVFVIRKDIEEAFKKTFGRRFESKIAVEYTFQELDLLPSGFKFPPGRTKPWGTGHAIWIAENKIAEPFAVINGDDFYGAESFKKIAHYLQTASDAQYAEYSMVGFVLRNTLSEHGSVARGVCQLDANGFLQTVTEYTKIEKKGAGAQHVEADGQTKQFSADEIVSMNLWGFTPSIFKSLHSQFTEFLKAKGNEEKSEFFIPSVVNRLITEKKARVKVLETKERWFGITYLADKATVSNNILELVRSGHYPKELWK
jgi:NDP-sugar pyrophosphorylase family protein